MHSSSATPRVRCSRRCVARSIACFRFSVRSDSPRQLVATATSVNTVVLAVLRECLEARNRRAAELEAAGRREFLPWTATRRHQLQELARLGLEQGVPACEEAAQRNRLHQQVVALLGQHRRRPQLDHARTYYILF